MVSVVIKMFRTKGVRSEILYTVRLCVMCKDNI